MPDIRHTARNFSLTASQLRQASTSLDHAGKDLLKQRWRDWQRHTEEGMSRIEAALSQLGTIAVEFDAEDAA